MGWQEMRVLLFIVSLPHWSTSLGFKAALLHEYPACRLNIHGSGLCQCNYIISHRSLLIFTLKDCSKHRWCNSVMTPVNGCGEAYHPITKPIPSVPALTGREIWIGWVGVHMYEQKKNNLCFIFQQFILVTCNVFN